MKFRFKTFLMAMAVSSIAYSDSTTINYGFTEEYYPSSSEVFQGEVPHSLGLKIGAQTDRDLYWKPVGTYYVTLDGSIKYEPNAEKYDHNRDPISLEGSFSVVKPLLRNILTDSIGIVTGGTLQMNGPQYNDNYGDLYVGLQAKEKVRTQSGTLDITATLGYIRYFYEVDDEPAKEQTNTERQFLAHRGNGPLVKVQVDYQADSNKLRLSYMEIKANDSLQNDNYSKSEIAVGIGRALSKKTECMLELKVTQHRYAPTALGHSDKMNTTELKCRRQF